MAWHRPILDIGGPLGDVDHPGDPSWPAGLTNTTLGLALAAPAPQRSSQILAELAPGLDEQRLIDRLVRHPHLRPVRELRDESGRDLLRRPTVPQAIDNELAKLTINSELAYLATASQFLGTAIRSPTPIVVSPPITADLSRNRGGRSAQLATNHRKRIATLKPSANLFALSQRQHPVRS